jgi:uncharacterized surface protein with fasciclin (FAS1) repeats
MFKIKHTTFALAFSGLVGLGAASCADDGDEPAATGTPSTTASPPTTGTPPTTPAAAKADIVATADAAGFKTLVAAVKAADLAATLQSPGPFTVFAPTDAAFAKLPAGTVETLLRPENRAMLQSILKYHVVAGKVTAADVVKLTSAKSVEGRDLAITVKDGTVRIDAANVTKADVEASNGVIHVIDAVLLPK